MNRGYYLPPYSPSTERYPREFTERATGWVCRGLPDLASGFATLISTSDPGYATDSPP